MISLRKYNKASIKPDICVRFFSNLAFQTLSMQRLRSAFLFLFCFLVVNSSAQQLPAQFSGLVKGRPPFDRINTIDSLASSYRRTDKPLTIYLLRVTVKEAKAAGLDSFLFVQRLTLSRFYRANGFNDSAMWQADTAIAEARLMGDSARVAEGLTNRGIIQTRLGFYDDASRTYAEGLRIAQQLQDTALIGRMNQHWGLMYFYMSDFNTAAEYTKKALQMFIAIRDTLSIAANLDNLGLYYSNLEKFDSAYKYQLQALPLFESEGDSTQLMVYYNNLGSTLARTGRYAEAEDYLNRSLAMAERRRDDYRIVTVWSSLAQLYADKKEEGKVQETAKRGYDLAVRIDNDFYAQQFAAALGESYYNTRAFEQAAYYYRISDQLREKIYDEETAKAADEASKKYQAAERQKQIEVLEAQNKAAEAKSERDRLIKWLIFGVAIVLLVFSAFVARRYYEKQKDNRLLKEKNDAIEQQKEVIELKNSEITDSINYATRIQNAVLPSSDKLSALFPDHFVYYRPRNIISGDFYWAAEGRNGVRFLAVADCTGHGVPGAMMSMLGTSILNRLIARKSVQGPGKILDALHEELLVTLNESKTARQVSDGMDIALLMYDPATGMITIASAERPVYYTFNRELHIVTPDKISIGSSITKNESYRETIIQAQPGLSLYLFTDGITDQFGGADKKKYMSKRLKELVIGHDGTSGSERAKIFASEFDEWKSGMEQTDDMTLINVNFH